MLLSKLVYYIVKNVKYLEDLGFIYESFKVGDFDNDLDYINSINNVFTPLNEAIHRLSDRNKIPNITMQVNAVNGVVDFSKIDKKIKKIISVFTLYKDKYLCCPFKYLGQYKILVNSKTPWVYIEFKEDIKNFEKIDFNYKDKEEYDGTNDIDLSEYGINETMISYIIEYCQGKLMETIAPEIANMHITRSEQYFNDLEDFSRNFHQEQITKINRIF